MGLFRLSGLAALIAICFAVAACSSGPAPGPRPAPAVDAAGAPASQVGLSNYELGNGDQLRVTVFGEPELSGEFVVDGTGQVSMPLVGEISVAGLTVRDFQRRLEAEFRDGGFLREPRIAAEVINYRPFYILGEVDDPG